MGWMVRELNPGGGEIFCTCPESGWGVALTTYPHLALSLKKE
jgi:hypothetical protein